MKTSVSPPEILSILHQKNRDPFQILGPHKVTLELKSMVSIRCFLPWAREARIRSLNDGRIYEMANLHPEGFFEALCEDRKEVFPYQIEVVRHDGHQTSFFDSYSFLPGLTNFDLYLIQEGCHYKTYDKLGAHLMDIQEVKGTYFAVWAPGALSVSVIGSFNDWDRRFHMMRTLGESGVWELFIPGIGEGEHYKYQITTWDNLLVDKTDPHGFYSELSPQTASIVYDLDHYQWGDREWMEHRAEKHKTSQPISIYEVHLGSWMRDDHRPKDFLSYRELAHKLVDYVKYMGYTHIELLPVQEHPFYGSWGYQTLGLYAPTSRYGEPADFMYLVDTLHQNGIGVFLDWVPAHFPKDIHGLAQFDGTFLYEHADPRKREQKDWNTHIYNYGRPEVKNFLISNGLFWLEKYHVDGLRVDAVTSMLYLDYAKGPGEWVPNKHGGRENLEAVSFLQEFNSLVQENHPGAVTIAEESTSWPNVSRPTYLGGLGFSYKWNMGWMNDMLKYMAADPVYRKFEHQTLAFSIWYSFNENYVLPLSHDEVVHLKRAMIKKMPGDMWKQFANVRLLYGFMFAHPGKKLLFMGNDFGQWEEWNHDRSLDWHLLQHEPHQKLHRYVRDLNHLYRGEPALHQKDPLSEGFEWVDFKDADHSVISFWRKGEEEDLLFIFNFTPVPWRGYRLGLDRPGVYQEIFNSDLPHYWGSGQGNYQELHTYPYPWQGRPCHLSLTIPPLGMVVMRPPARPQEPKVQNKREEPIEVNTSEKAEEKPIEVNTGEKAEKPVEGNTSVKAEKPIAVNTGEKKGKKGKKKKEKKKEKKKR